MGSLGVSHCSMAQEYPRDLAIHTEVHLSAEGIERLPQMEVAKAEKEYRPEQTSQANFDFQKTAATLKITSIRFPSV